MTEPIFIMDEDFKDDIFNYLQPPNDKGFTIYGKSDCPKCDVLKLQMYDCCECSQYINCDEYLKTDKERFKKIMFLYMKQTYYDRGSNIMYFPLVFYNGDVITNYHKFFQ